MVNLYRERITDCAILQKGYTLHDGYIFTSITHPANIYDAIVIKNSCYAPIAADSVHSIEEHIDYINKHHIDKALIIAEDIAFIAKCPNLQHLKIIPADSTIGNFDYSPLYELPVIKSLQCATQYGDNEKLTTIDYAKVVGLEDICISGCGHLNYETVGTLKSLEITGYTGTDVTNMFCSSVLDTLMLIQCQVQSLEGLQKSEKMQCLYLHYNRSLYDISALRRVKNTLQALRIENCPKIKDFSVLAELENLKLLELSGSNSLPNLYFLKSMKQLKTFIFNMNVLDGNLLPCMDLSYVFSEKNRKHYNLKDQNLPKGQYIRGNETIELWRRME